MCVKSGFSGIPQSLFWQTFQLPLILRMWTQNPHTCWHSSLRPLSLPGPDVLDPHKLSTSGEGHLYVLSPTAMNLVLHQPPAEGQARD